MTDIIETYVPEFLKVRRAQIAEVSKNEFYNGPTKAILNEDVSVHQNGTVENIADWKNKGQPECWVLAEVVDIFECWLDYGYGQLSIFDTLTKELVAGYDRVILQSGKAIVLNKDYYELPGYIYIKGG